MFPVSVVVPLYNKGPFLLRTLRSIAHQTYNNFEVIIVNDGSTDNGEDIAHSFQDSRFRVVSQKNAGPGAARNRGIAEASGQLIAFCDADDEWLPHYLEAAVRAFTDQPDLAAFSQCYIEYPAARSTAPMFRKRGLFDGEQNVESHSAELLHHMLIYMTPPSTVIRADVVRKWGGFYEHRCTFGEDSFLMLQILLHERVVFSLQDGVSVHRESGALSQNLSGARPEEPFLAHPEYVEGTCPPNLLPLLHGLYAIRAFKTACVWGYYGDWRRARQVRRQFRVKGDVRLPYYVSSWICSTPLGALAGAAWRTLLSVRPNSPPVPQQKDVAGDGKRHLSRLSGS